MFMVHLVSTFHRFSPLGRSLLLEPRDLRIQRVVSDPVVELVQQGAERKDQVTEETAREQEGGPGFSAVEPGMAISQHD